MPFHDVGDGILGHTVFTSGSTVGAPLDNGLDDLWGQFVRFRALAGLATGFLATCSRGDVV